MPEDKRGEHTAEKGSTVLYDYVLSPLYDQVTVLIPASITPNSITLFGGALCATSFVLQQQGRFALSALLFGLYLVADNVDGKHARATGQTSEWGAVLDHGVDGLICSPTLGTATARFLGIPAFPVCRLIFAAFFGCHVIEAATGKLNMGAAFYGADEASLQVLFQLILEAAGYTNVLSTVLGVAEPEPAAAFVIRPVLAIVLCVWQFYWLFVQETKQGKINFTKLAIWLPFYLLIFFIPPEYGEQGESEYTGALPLVLYGCFAPPLCVLLLANSGLLRGKDEKAA